MRREEAITAAPDLAVLAQANKTAPSAACGARGCGGGRLPVSPRRQEEERDVLYEGRVSSSCTNI